MGDLDELGQRAQGSEWLRRAARYGFVTYGVIYLLVGYLAARLALGERRTNASSDGALHTLARQPLGGPLLWAVAAGLAFLALWRLVDAVAGGRGEREQAAGARLAAAGKAVVYAALAVSAVQVAAGDSSGGGPSWSARLMDLPAGPWLVGLVGAGVLGYAAVQVRTAWTDRLRDKLAAEGTTGEAGRVYLAFGRAGYTARGVAFGVIGALVVYAAVTHDPQKTAGLDQALQTILRQPLGPVLLAAVALGIASYGLFAFARARHLAR